MKKVLLTMMAVVALTITSCCNKAKETACDKANTECAAKHECKKACENACEMPDSCKKACEKACDFIDCGQKDDGKPKPKII